MKTKFKISGIGIIGSRKRDSHKDFLIVRKKFIEIYEKGDWIISGGCPKGGDRFAEIIARKGFPILIFYPDWEKLGKIAGFIRNTEIAKFSTKAMIACVTNNRVGGTEDTIEKYLKFNGKNLILC